MKQKVLWTYILVFLLSSGCARHVADRHSPYRDLAVLGEGDIVHLSTGVKVTPDTLINLVDTARIVYVGEAHDNIKCHEVQLTILQALYERYPGEVAVGMEMLQRPSQDIASRWSAGELDEKSFVKTWTENWSNDFVLYRDILQYVRDKNIPLIALRASNEWMDRARMDETIDHPESDRDLLPELDLHDPYHRSHIEAVFSKHPHGKQDFEAFYRVQVLWDESMAQSLAEYLQGDEGRDKRVIVLAGNHHVEYGYGIPRRLFRRMPLPYVIVLPITRFTPGGKQPRLMHVTLPEIPLQPADFVWIVGYDDLSDQRVYLGAMIRETDEGVKVLGTMKNSMAKKAGLEKEDLIVAIDGEPIKTRFDLTYAIDRKRPGDEGVIEVVRNEEPLTFEVTFESRGVLRENP